MFFWVNCKFTINYIVMFLGHSEVFILENAVMYDRLSLNTDLSCHKLKANKKGTFLTIKN